MPLTTEERNIMTTANRLIAVLNKAKANRLDVQIKEQANGEILATVSDGGYVSESFLSGSLDHLVWKLEIIVEDMQII
ncbi:hypothetical protein nepoznato_137 [Escherichia phage nepoznato]|uniref:Uncharacterized protein n=5 Tax=Caudoviricetes TaxID=2731619 RepID=A0A6B9WLH7_9CAUD|nr:hypothetical protein JR323_gp140 [Escherichia phage nepoznato]QHR65586.1 hypothetical protein nepoznato_137 [Escherichia phage nepoznato]